ncbi:LysR family transcriptional regulator [Acetobacter oeni]|nr:LysR family transcriptional regulator [Acetobacter oeni]MBB3884830.1 DNA-binding transcriptional LysR family regulator [Acetobacter oeni]NHO20770.1 LysR family transcriptional regulator [Acetobacter oeni]
MSLRVTLRQLEYFVAVGESGSVAGAAEKLNVSSPSISSAIGQLEFSFGIQLFIRRHAHGLSLTQGGMRFLDGAREILARVRLLSEVSNEITGSVRGPLNVGCLLTFAQIILPRLRRGFVDAYPEVVFHQFEHDQQGLFDALRGAKTDIALTYDLNIPSDLDFIPIVDLPPFVLVGEAHPLADRKSVSVPDLADYPMVLLDLPMSSNYFLSLFSDHNVTPVIAERTRDIAVMKSLVANGFGYSLANVRPLSDLAPDGSKLKFISLAGNLRALRLGLLMSEAAKNSLTIRTFVEYAEKNIAHLHPFEE